MFKIEPVWYVACTLILVLGSTPHHKFIIPIKSEEYEPDTDKGLTCKLKFSYTAKYPEEAPAVEICDSENFEEEDEPLLKEHIIQQVGFEYWYIFVQLAYFKFWLETSLLKHLQQNCCISQKKIEGKIILYPYAVSPDSSYSVTSRGIVFNHTYF